MALTIAPGYTQLSGGLVTPSRMNTAITGIVISMAATKLLGTTGAGAAGEIGYTAAGLAMLQAADVAAQQTLLGIGVGAKVESDIALAKGIQKATGVASGTSAAISFDTANAPSVALTAGTWLVSGTVAISTSYTTPSYACFYNSTDAVEFGSSGAILGSGASPAFVAVVPVFGVITVAAGTKTIIFRGHTKNTNANPGAFTYGTADVDTPAGYIVATKLFS